MRTDGLGSAIIPSPANGPYHPSRMNYAGTRPIRSKPPVTVFTTTGVPAGTWPRNLPRSWELGGWGPAPPIMTCRSDPS